MGQTRPPFLVVVMMERVVEWVPVAQVAEQAVYLAQLETLQSTGQPKVLQDLVFLRATQATPPNWAAVRVERERDLRPEAQDLEQEPKADQEETLQSMGHLTVLQER